MSKVNLRPSSSTDLSRPPSISKRQRRRPPNHKLPFPPLPAVAGAYRLSRTNELQRSRAEADEWRRESAACLADTHHPRPDGNTRRGLLSSQRVGIP